MNQLDFLQAAALTSSDFNQRTEFLLPDFIAKGLITLIYADGGAGKSWLGLALARHCAVCRQQVYYLDFDNPLSALKERNVHNLLVRGFDNLHYLQRSKCQYSSLELLQRLGAVAAAERFANCVFVVDSLRALTQPLNKTLLLEAVGRKKDDKTARGWLDQFDGVYWQGHKAGGIYTYTALGATAGSST